MLFDKTGSVSDDDVDDGALLRAMREKLHNIEDHPTCDATMSIKNITSNKYSVYSDVVSDENWFLFSDDDDVDDGTLLGCVWKYPSTEDHPDL